MPKLKRRRKQIEPDDGRRLIGYARVSTEDQNLAMQLEALRNAGVMDVNLYTDKASGRTMNRRGLKEALLDARPGDQFVVWKLDRLSRSAMDMLYLYKRFKDDGIHLRSLSESLDTTTPIGNFMLHLMAGLAELESNETGFRTKRGMDTASREGRKFGPDGRVNDGDMKAIKEMFKEGASAEQVGREYGLTGQRIRQIVLAKFGKALWKTKPRKKRKP